MLARAALTGRANAPDRRLLLWQQALKHKDQGAYEALSSPTSRLARHPQPISFTSIGDPCKFPLKAFYKAMQSVMRRDGIAALTYGEFNNGYTPLRTTLAHVLASQGAQTHPDQILITSGSQQALALVCQILLKPGDVVLVESPS